MNLSAWVEPATQQVKSDAATAKITADQAVPNTDNADQINSAATSAAVVESEIQPSTEQKMPTNDELPGACRVQSPSSILTYNQCPRKYYYRYIEKLPGGKSIHLVRGVVAHKVLEDIFDVDFSQVPKESFFNSLKIVLQEHYRKEWRKSSAQLAELGLSEESLQEYFEETALMVDNFFHHMYDRMQPLLATMSPQEAWDLLTPEREILMKSPKHIVRGYVDAIENNTDGTSCIIDYKTSKKFEITKDYHLQLGIYAMMHEELRGKLPEEVGVFFLKHGKELRIPVEPALVDHAKNTCNHIQRSTHSTDIDAYPQKPTPLCKWKTGQCEYYELCFAGRSVQEHREMMGMKR